MYQTISPCSQISSDKYVRKASVIVTTKGTLVQKTTPFIPILTIQVQTLKYVICTYKYTECLTSLTFIRTSYIDCGPVYTLPVRIVKQK